jgi:U3 small nucleolar RNA-associated protein 20
VFLTLYAEKQLLNIASQYLKLPHRPNLHDTSLRFCVAIFLAGDMSFWMTSARKIVEGSWEDTDFAIRLSGALSDLDWGGWKLFVSPQVVKRLPMLLEENLEQALNLLAVLYRKRRLEDIEAPLRQKIDSWVSARLRGWTLTPENVCKI